MKTTADDRSSRRASRKRARKNEETASGKWLNFEGYIATEKNTASSTVIRPLITQVLEMTPKEMERFCKLDEESFKQLGTNLAYFKIAWQLKDSTETKDSNKTEEE
ncbi:MAG: hypothetical protein J6Q65_07045 [Lentisphaeria bacterium]|nr:hypothetical protein [Lentisphaeria bacterium]